MTATQMCLSCKKPLSDVEANFCVWCGAKIPAPAPVAQHALHLDKLEPLYSKGFINIVRLLSAVAMFSALFAVIQFDSNTTDGRLLIVIGVLTSVSGQLFVMQGSKANPPTWVQVPLTLLGVGFFAIIIAWIVVAV